MIDNGTPKVLNIKDIISKYIDFQKEVIIRRTKFDLKKKRRKSSYFRGLQNCS